MPVLLQYEFTTGSLAAVKRGFKSIEGEVEKSVRSEERVRNRAAAKAPRERARAAIDPQKKALDDLSKFGATRMRQELQERDRIQKRGHADRLRQIEREKTESIAATKAQDRVRRATVGNMASAAFRSTVGVGKAILGATGLAGGAIAASRIGPGIDLQHQQRQIIRNARGAGEDSAYSEEDVRKKVLGISTATGASESSITAGLGAYVSRTGDLKGGMESLQTFTTIAQAADASVEDIAKSAAALSDSLDIKGTDAMADALASIYFQGKKGAFELKDMASHMAMLAAIGASVGVKGPEGVKTIGGLAQLAMKGAGDPAEAATALQQSMTQLIEKSGDLESGKALGGRKVHVFADKGKTKFNDIRGVYADVISQARGNVEEISKVFAVRGNRAAVKMVDAYHGAYSSAGGGDTAKNAAGREAIMALIADASDAAGTFKDVQVDAADAMKDGSAQLEIMNTKLTESVREHLLPALLELVPKIEPLIPAFGTLLDKVATLIGWMAENPWSGLGALVMGNVTADLAAAGIGSAVKSMIVSLIAEGGAAKIVGGIAGGVAGAAGGVGGALGLGAAGTAALALGGAGALAAAGIGAAGYQAYGLYKDVSQSGWGTNTAKANTPEQYDAMVKALEKNNAALADNTAATRASGNGAGPMGPSSAPNRGPDPTAPR